MGPGQAEAQLVDGQAQILDLVEGEPEAGSEAGGGHPGQAQELG